jgi:hypothetical protein
MNAIPIAIAIGAACAFFATVISAWGWMFL